MVSAKLTTLKIKSAKPGRHADGDGLYLVVQDSGSRSWMLRIQANGRRRDIGLGSASKVTLSDARTAAREAREAAAKGLDPVAERQKARVVVPTFEAAARGCHAEMKPGWKNGKHAASWLSSMASHVFPTIGSRPVDSIDSVAVRDALAPIWLTTPEMARRNLQRIGAVLDFAHIKGWRATEAALRSVKKGLPRQPRRDSHFEAMPFVDVPGFAADLAAAPTAGRDALLFTILTAVRSGEARLATWSEFDLDQALWSIPGARMKMNEPHVVPLAPAVVGLLRRRWEGRTRNDDLVFWATHGRPLSDMTMIKILRGAKRPFTVHGFRSSFRDWAAEETDFPSEVVEKALAHAIPNKVEAAYRRTDFLEKRRKLMADWAAFVSDDA